MSTGGGQLWKRQKLSHGGYAQEQVNKFLITVLCRWTMLQMKKKMARNMKELCRFSILNIDALRQQSFTVFFLLKPEKMEPVYN